MTAPAIRSFTSSEPWSSSSSSGTPPSSRMRSIFVDAPLDELERRLRGRATESGGEIEERIVLAARQKESADRFDYVVENDDRARAAEECVAIVQRELNSAATMARSSFTLASINFNEDSRYALAIVAAERKRHINDYHHQLGEGTFRRARPAAYPVALEELLDHVPRGKQAEGEVDSDYSR